jgi:hypothetical protein
MASEQLTEDDFLFLPLAEATAPTKGVYFQCYRDYWWAVHPEKGLVFFNPKNRRTGRRKAFRWGWPQCNMDARIKQLTAEDRLPFAVEVIKVPFAFVEIDLPRGD